MVLALQPGLPADQPRNPDSIPAANQPAIPDGNQPAIPAVNAQQNPTADQPNIQQP